METTLYAYQITPGSDNLLWFAESQDACETAAREQRAELRKYDPDVPLGPISVYRYTLRGLSTAELVEVLNDQTTLLPTITVDRRLVAEITD